MYDIIIIGGGIAGMTAAIYAKRSGKEVLIIEKETFGGQLINAPAVENYPGFMKIDGLSLMVEVFQQMKNLNVDYEYAEVLSVEKSHNYFYVKTNNMTYGSHSIIIATGTERKQLQNISGSNVSYCVMCDGAFYQDQEVAVIGDGNSALQYSIMLSNICKKVYLCTLTDKLFGDYSLVERVKRIDKIEHIKNITTESYSEDLLLYRKADGLYDTLKVKGVFVAIGLIPNTSVFKNIVKLNEKGYIKNNDMEVIDCPGLFVAGDCREKISIYQAISAASDGADAAMKAVNYLNSKF